MALRNSALALLACSINGINGDVGAEANATNTRRLKIVNGCNREPIWIANINGQDQQNVRLAPGQSRSFQTAGVEAARWWPKAGCDGNGNNCAVGSSGGPGQSCNRGGDYSRCAPPADSKFEATFHASGTEIIDMSVVDGYSLPFTMQASGSCRRNNQPWNYLDCRSLSLARCPTQENINGRSANLKATNPRTGQVTNCYSPCLYLNDDKWSHSRFGSSAPYCCAGAYNQPGSCAAGPIVRTQYLSEVHSMCPDAYGYPYDDKVGTISCSVTTEYTLTFMCPTTEGGVSPSPPRRRAPSPPRRRAPSPSGCTDYDPKCAQYRSYGWCTDSPAHHANYEYSLTQCKRTCGFCGGSCTDYDPKCAQYRSYGWCTDSPAHHANYEYSLSQCKRTCGFCRAEGELAGNETVDVVV